MEATKFKPTMKDFMEILEPVTKGKFTEDETFEVIWYIYGRKGNKKRAKSLWNNLTDENKLMVKYHISWYIYTREMKFRKNFDNYLSQNEWKNPIYNEEN